MDEGQGRAETNHWHTGWMGNIKLYSVRTTASHAHAVPLRYLCKQENFRFLFFPSPGRTSCAVAMTGAAEDSTHCALRIGIRDMC
jgi:hypothetical protein